MAGLPSLDVLCSAPKTQVLNVDHPFQNNPTVRLDGNMLLHVESYALCFLGSRSPTLPHLLSIRLNGSCASLM